MTSRAFHENLILPIVLSVVMPAYNEEANIEQVILEHLQVLATLGEIVKDWEIVCLDDDSTARTPEILKRIAARVDKLRVIRHSENRGICRFAHLFQVARETHIYATAADGQWPATFLWCGTAS